MVMMVICPPCCDGDGGGGYGDVPVVVVVLVVYILLVYMNLFYIFHPHFVGPVVFAVENNDNKNMNNNL